jgi:hypothetical protein
LCWRRGPGEQRWRSVRFRLGWVFK